MLSVTVDHPLTGEVATYVTLISPSEDEPGEHHE